MIVIINACKYNQSLGFQSMLLTDFTFVFRVTIYDFFLAVFWFPASARFLFRQKLPSRLLPNILRLFDSCLMASFFSATAAFTSAVSNSFPPATGICLPISFWISFRYGTPLHRRMNKRHRCVRHGLYVRYDVRMFPAHSAVRNLSHAKDDPRRYRGRQYP